MEHNHDPKSFSTAEESSASSEELAAQTQTLQQEVERFTLNEEPSVSYKYGRRTFESPQRSLFHHHFLNVQYQLKRLFFCIWP